jgi:hypothetical protein
VGFEVWSSPTGGDALMSNRQNRGSAKKLQQKLFVHRVSDNRSHERNTALQTETAIDISISLSIFIMNRQQLLFSKEPGCKHASTPFQINDNFTIPLVLLYLNDIDVLSHFLVI